MIDLSLKPRIQNDLDSDSVRIDYLLHITKGIQHIYISTSEQSFNDENDENVVFWEDANLKISNLTEKIDIIKKTIYTPNISVGMSNYKIAWNDSDGKEQRLSDFLGAGHGVSMDVYMKTPSCRTIEDCIQITELAISRMNHDISQVTIQAEDKSQQGFYVDLPRQENVLTEDETFEFYAGSPIPILYGHLESAPAVVYFDQIQVSGEDSVYENNLITILPDSSYLNDDSEIIGIKNFGWDGLWEGFGNESPDFTLSSRMYHEVKNNDILQVDISNSLCSVLHYPYWNTRDAIVDEFKSENYSGLYNQYRVYNDRIQLITKYETDYTLLKKNALWVHSNSKLISTEGYALTAYSGGEYESWDAPVYYFAHQASKLSNGFTRWGTGSEDQNDLYTGYRAFHYEDEITDLFGGSYDAWEHRVALETLDFEPFSGVNLYFTVNTEGEDEYLPIDSHVVADFQMRLNSKWQPGRDYSVIRMYGVPAGVRIAEDNFVNWNVHFSDDYDGEQTSSIGFPAEISSDFSINKHWGDGDQSWFDVNMSQIFIDVDDYDSHRNLIYSSNFAMNASGESSHNSVDYKYCDYVSTYETYLHPWNTSKDSSMGWDNSLFYNYYDSLPDESLSKDFNSLDFDQITFYYMHAAEEDSVAQFSDPIPGCVYVLDTLWDKDTYLRKTWAEADIFTKKFFVNAKGRSSTPIQQNYKRINGVLEVRYEGEDPSPSSNDRELPTNNHLKSLYKCLTKKELKRFSFGEDTYELMIVSNVDGQKSYIYDLDLLDCNHTDNLQYSSQQTPSWLSDLNEEGELSVAHSIGWSIIFEGKTFGEFNTDESMPNEDMKVLNGINLVYAKKVYSLSGDQLSLISINEFQAENESIASEQIEMIDTFNLHNRANLDLLNPNSNYSFQGYTIGYFNDSVADNSKYLIEKPAEIIKDIVSKEIAPTAPNFNADKYAQAITADAEMNMAFSLYNNNNSKKVLENICQQSRLFFRYRARDGQPIIESIKNIYQESDVDGIIKTENLLSYSFDKTKIEELCIGGCLVRYGFNYHTEKTVKETETKELQDTLKSSYLTYYSIEEEELENYVLEVDAPYIQDEQSALRLRNYLFEMQKNQHLLMKFKLPIKDGSVYEVGDVISFSDNPGGLKAYGKSILDVSTIVEQTVFPYFMITEVVRRPKDISFVAYQLHELKPTMRDVTLLGDINLDGAVNFVDRDILINYIAGNGHLSAQQLANADINGDGSIDAFDLIQLLQLEYYDHEFEEQYTNEDLQGDLFPVLNVNGQQVGSQLWINAETESIILSGANSYVSGGLADDSSISYYRFKLIDSGGNTIIDRSVEENSFSIETETIELGTYRASLSITGNYGVISETVESPEIFLFANPGEIFTKLFLYADGEPQGEEDWGFPPANDYIYSDANLLIESINTLSDPVSGETIDVTGGDEISSYYFKVMYIGDIGNGEYYVGDDLDGNPIFSRVPWELADSLLEVNQESNAINFYPYYPGTYWVFCYPTAPGYQSYSKSMQFNVRDSYYRDFESGQEGNVGS